MPPLITPKVETDFCDPHVCKRCADQGSTCCNLEPGEESECFPISEMERERILEVIGSDKGGFVQEANRSSFVENMKRLFPKEGKLIDQLFPGAKFHLRLATRTDGSCVFLEADGCGLPREVRPYYCLLYPFWVTGRRLTVFLSSGCLVVNENRDVAGVLRAMDMTDAEVRMLHGRLRLAWGLPPEEGMPLLEQAFTRYKKTK